VRYIVRYTLYQYAKHVSLVECLALFDVHKADLTDMFNLYILNCLLWNDMSKHVALTMRPSVIEFVVCDGTYGTCEYCEQNLAWLLFLSVSALPMLTFRATDFELEP
jgi:hypothetical protein